MEDVSEQLAKSAPRFARDALAALSNGDDVGFALYAATSLEHLLKSFLAGKHPALIVEARNLDSLLHACGQDAAAKTSRDRVKTVSAAESLLRVARFLPLAGSQLALLDELFGIRNGAVHLADSRSVARLVLPFVQASEQVRESVGLDRDEYWGEYVPLVDRTLEEHVAAAELRATAAVAAAKRTFAQRFGELEDRARAAALTALDADTFWGDEEQPVQCPACGRTATATGLVETEWHYEQVGEDDYDAQLEATFVPESLKCNVCGLRLGDQEELRFVGVAARWDIEVDPEHYVDDDYHEPDEDWYRGR